ncbi:hypothetical protein HDU93_000745 [Gonapodya sp. JEL0774]|nr:hypothetical protein HDU93_000745 [Gonapodya sp. JEL0774]
MSAPEKELIVGGETTTTTWTREEEAALVRKLDWRLMPQAVTMLFLAYLDRGNISNARVVNIGTPQGFEVELGWGIVSGCQAACSNLAGVLVCRLLVGAAEAGLLPGLLFWISFWYRKYEIASRTALIHSMTSFSGAVSGLLASAIAQMNGVGGLSAWRWIFITQRETQIAIARLPPSAPSHLQKHFDITELIAMLTDPMMHLYAFAFAIGVLPQLGLAYFLPTILSGMGFTGVYANLMSAWPNLWGFLFDIFMGFHGDYRKERVLHIIVPSVISMVGFILLTVSARGGWSTALRYFFTFMAASGIGVAPAWYAWRQNMLVGATANAFSVAYLGTILNISGAVAPYIYPTSNAPLYTMGGIVSSCCWAASIFGVFLIYLYDEHRRKAGFYDAIEQEAKSEIDRLNAMYLAAEGKNRSDL